MLKVNNISIIIRKLKTLALSALRVANIRFVRSTEIKKPVNVSNVIQLSSIFDSIVTTLSIKKKVKSSLSLTSVYENTLTPLPKEISVNSVLNINGIYESVVTGPKKVNVNSFVFATPIYDSILDATGNFYTTLNSVAKIESDADYDTENIT